jgi:alanyl aminopeptidase
MIAFRRCAFLLVLLSLPVAATGGAARPPKLRLGDGARPLRYAARVVVQPTQESFSGVIDIELELKAATKLLWLNATDLTVDAAQFDVGGKQIAAKPVAGGEDFVGFATDKLIGPGPAKLHVVYKGRVSRKDDRGLFAQKEGDAWYAISQFEAIFARRVFPCFDEPSYKVPWQLTIEAPEGDAVFSNTSPVSEKKERPGFKTITFAATRPLPSYLVAFAVGPYDVVDAGRAGLNKIPIRIAAPHGRGKDARLAAKLTGPTVERLEKYFGSPFPYDKLDVVAIPMPTQFGAMENPGMVTVAQSKFVAHPEDETIDFERSYISYAAHEFAHQWFGDLVTTAWWDDIWLNESFASWLEEKISDEWHPEWTHHASLVHNRAHAMAADSLVSARRVRQPVVTNDEIYNAFDGGITYAKGEAVINMFERFVGPPTFQRGVRKYIADHADGNATVNDFVAAVSSVAGRDLGPAFKSFLDQAGAPLVSASVSCGDGKPTTVQLVQQRFLPLGAKGAPAKQQWQFPVCVKWPQAGGKLGQTCAMMSEPELTLPLPEVKQCPAWLLANDQEVGYYRVAYQGDGLKRLLKDGGKQLSLPELVGVLDDVRALVASGKLPLGDLLALLPSLANDPRRDVAEATVRAADQLSDHMVPEELRPNYARFVQRLFGARARALGWLPRAKEDADTRLLRPSLLRLVADAGADAGLRAQATELANKWLADRRAVDAEVVPSILGVAASIGDRALFDRMYAEARREPERTNRLRIFHAMGRFRDPALLRAAHALVLSDEFDPRESFEIVMFRHFQPGRERPLAWEFVKQNFDALWKRLPAETVATLPMVAVELCDAEHAREMSAFFKDRSPKLPGGPHELAEAEEEIGLCQAYVAAQRPSAVSFLKTF